MGVQLIKFWIYFLKIISLSPKNFKAIGGLHGRKLQGPEDWSRCTQAGPDSHVNKKKTMPDSLF
jgi:hypothetical protein